MLVMSNPELLMQLSMDSASLGVLKAHQIDNNTYVELESVSRNMCFALHFKKGTTPECEPTDLIFDHMS